MLLTISSTMITGSGSSPLAPLVVIIASIAGVSLAVFWELGDIGALVLTVVLALVGISSLAAIQRLKVEPILMDAPLTNEQITYAEMRKADEDSTPPEQARWRWLRSAGMCVLSAFLIILNWAGPGRQAGMMLFTLLCLYSGWQAIRWNRSTRAGQSRSDNRFGVVNHFSIPPRLPYLG